MAMRAVLARGTARSVRRASTSGISILNQKQQYLTKTANAATTRRQQSHSCEATRLLSTSSLAREAGNTKSSEPEYATTSDEVKIDWPSVEERVDPEDVGHNTTGPGVGRHRSRTLESLSLVGKVCVVTGAARGLGNLMARTLVESGANALAILDLDPKISEEAARDVEQWFTEHGGAKKGEVQAIGLGCDVSNEDAVKKAMQQVVDRFGKIDVLVTAAGIVHNYPATEYPTEKMRQLYGINIDGTFFCAREAAKHMLTTNTNGSIVLIGSMSGSIVNVPQPQTPYNASKAAVKHMASSLAVEWAKKGIRVNSIAPGYMVTSLTRTILDNNPELEATWTSLTPVGRLGVPEDLKGAIVFLASDASTYVTGTELRVDGGYACT